MLIVINLDDLITIIGFLLRIWSAINIWFLGKGYIYMNISGHFSCELEVNNIWFIVASSHVKKKAFPIYSYKATMIHL